LFLKRFVRLGGSEKQAEKRDKMPWQKGYEFNAQKNKKNNGTIECS